MARVCHARKLRFRLLVFPILEASELGFIMYEHELFTQIYSKGKEILIAH